MELCSNNAHLGRHFCSVIWNDLNGRSFVVTAVQCYFKMCSYLAGTGQTRNAYKVLSGRTAEETNLEDLGIDSGMILNLVVSK